MEAFAGALGLGYSHLETDLQITADGVLVCVHDQTVDRTTEGSGAVDSFTLDELQALDAGFRHGSRDGFRFRSTGVRIPALEELVTSFRDARLVVDLKRDGLVEPLARVIDHHRLHDRLIVASHSDGRLAHFRTVTGGRVATSTGSTFSRLWFLVSRAGLRGPGRGSSALQLPTQTRGVRVIDERLVDVAHSAGLQVHVWTVNRANEMERFLDIGVDGIVTDRPDLLKGVLLERGEWRGG